MAEIHCDIGLWMFFIDFKRELYTRKQYIILSNLGTLGKQYDHNCMSERLFLCQGGLCPVKQNVRALE